MAGSSSGRRRRAFAPLAPGVAKVRLRGGTSATDVLLAILRGHPSVEVIKGPDEYDDGRRYLTVRVLSPAGVLAALSAERAPAEDALLLDTLHPDRDGEAAGELPSAARVAALEGRLEGLALLPAPCGEYITRVPYGPCETCGRSRLANDRPHPDPCGGSPVE